MPFKLPSLPDVPGTDPSRAVLDSFKVAIAKRVADALPPLTVEQVYQGVDYGKKGVDFTIALPRFRLPGKVDVLAKTVIDQFQADDFVESVTHDKAFLHFMLKTPSLVRAVLTQVHELTYDAPSGSPEYGTNTSGTGKKVVIEYSSPNIAKSFHVGHLRSTIIGAFLANLYNLAGGKSYWGTQFGLIAVGFEKYGSEEELQKDAIKHLLTCQRSGGRMVKRMEDGDEDALKNWRVWRELSVKKYAEEYERLNVHFDVYTGESKVGKKWQDFALERLNEMGLISDVEGAKLVDLEKWKLGKAVLRKRDGTSIYLTRDIGGAIERYEQHKFDKMLYMLHLMEFPWASSIEHVNYGLVLGMSTRKGNVVFLEQIIREAASVMHEQMKKNQENLEVGLAAIKIQDMAAKRINNYSFNWNRMTSFEGDTGPYLQYAHVRLTSLTRKNPSSCRCPHRIRSPRRRSRSSPRRGNRVPPGHVPGRGAHGAAHARAERRRHVCVPPCARYFERDVERARARMWLYLCARDVLGAAMRLLSIRPLERM
ncbi:hypothetical protein BJV77DRAFT_1058705 [Russula vinacea]|nr:hypothetical protein BJV77DRAFT_1058705 [Russula vinacea]